MHSYRVASMLHVASYIAGALRALLIQGERGAPICLYSDIFSPSNQNGRAQERTMPLVSRLCSILPHSAGAPEHLPQGKKDAPTCINFLFSSPSDQKAAPP